MLFIPMQGGLKEGAVSGSRSRLLQREEAQPHVLARGDVPHLSLLQSPDPPTAGDRTPIAVQVRYPNQRCYTI